MKVVYLVPSDESRFDREKVRRDVEDRLNDRGLELELSRDGDYYTIDRQYESKLVNIFVNRRVTFEKVS
jgi:hypothetical protein